MKTLLQYSLFGSIILLFVCSANKLVAQPNVVVILTDDQGWGDLSHSGNTNISTPNIDNLAKNGASFVNYYVNPVCSPTRAEMLTGRYNFRGGVYHTSIGGERLDLDETTIGDVFKNAGYKTAAYGKWHNGMQYPYHPNGRGFDDFYGFCSGHWGNYLSPILEHNGKIVKGKGFIVDDLTNRGLDFIEKNKNNPFLLYLPYPTPHTPFHMEDELWNSVKDREIKMWSDKKSHEDMESTRAAIALCENIDWNVGRITKKLDKLGLTENTIIVYFHDNGPNRYRWNGGMKGKKGNTDEGGIRSPLFVQWKNHIKKIEIEEISSAADLLPTLAELCDIDYSTNKKLDGKSLKPLIMDEKVNWADRFIANSFRSRVSIRSQEFRLDEKGNLYRIVDDRGQKKIVNDKYPKEYKSHMDVMNDIKRQVKEELPAKDPRPFIIGHPDAKYTQIPARDGKARGNIKRSNKYPNCSYFTNWTSVKDYISWNAEVAADGKFKVAVYYTCPKEDVGSTIQLAVGNSKISAQITEAYNPDLQHMDKYRGKGFDAFTKKFNTLEMGEIELKKGDSLIKLSALDMKGKSVIDFRLMMFERIK